MHKYIFTDTNLFEQFQPITDIDWLRLADCESATLLVPTVTIRELNEHKDGATRGRLKRRAAAVLVDLKKYSDQGTPVTMRDGVTLDFRIYEPLIDFAAFHLDKGLNDDRLIASAIEFATETKIPAECVLVATGDFGLELKVKSQPLIRPLPLPSGLRLADELDADEKRIKELEAENSELRSVRPKLTLTFANGSNVEKRVPERAELSEERLQELLREVREEHPYRKATPPRSKGHTAFDLAAMESQTRNDYNISLDTYYSEMEEYFRECAKVRVWRSRTAEIDLVLSNVGTTPADDIDVRLRFAKDIVTFKESGLPGLPEKPRPPREPSSSPLAALAASLADPDWPRTARFSDLQNYVRPLDLPNASVYLVKEGGAEFHIRKLKHLTEETLPTIYLHFESGLRSCGLEYEVIAGNMPEALMGTLALVIE